MVKSQYVVEIRTAIDGVEVALLELLRKAGADGDVDLLREGVRVLLQGLMEAEVSERVGAERSGTSGPKADWPIGTGTGNGTGTLGSARSRCGFPS